ncbi:MAG: cysteine desulfurase [Oscillospiraceae bacterium]|nr:cysteine desulfurase [Oscillospiraceae bacterium]
MIYLDYAASSPPYPQVVEKMRDIMCTSYGNASGIHPMAEKSRLIIRQSRRTLAELLEVQPQQVFFTSGATEANNWAVKSAMAAGGKRHMIIFAPEHSSVIAAARYMEARGFELTWLRPDGDGLLSSETVERAIRPDTGLLCVQAVNNETGVMQDVEAMAQLARKKGILYHCDGVQSFAHCQQPLKLPDFVSLSAHKLGGPAGVGALIVRRPDLISPFIHGGGQELGYRAGTENTAGAAGFATAAELAFEEKEREQTRLERLSAQFVSAMKALDERIRLNGENAPRRAGILNFFFPQISGEELVLRLARADICASPGAACASRDGAPSHVLMAMGLSKEAAGNSVRFSFGRLTTEEELKETVNVIRKILGKGE